MAKHKFDGDWDYFEIIPPGIPNAEGKMSLTIPDAATGKLEPGSKRKGDLTGNATNTGFKKMRETEPTHERDYDGELIFEKDGHMVIVGTFKGKNIPPPEEAKALAQDEGVWIIIK